MIGGISEIGKIGIGLSEPLVITRLEYNFFEAVAYGYEEMISSISMTGYYIGRVIKGEEDGKQLGSIIKIATISGKVAVDAINENTPITVRLRELSVRLLTIGASLSVALGIANLMPIPMLDGGHLVYYGYEAITGRPLSQKKQEMGFQLGLAILFTLFVVLTLNDISYVSSIFFLSKLFKVMDNKFMLLTSRYLFLGLTMALMFGVAPKVYAQESTALSAEMPTIIRGIEVQGNQRVEANTVASYLLISPGDPYSEERIDMSVKTLFATGLFADVAILPNAEGILLIRVIENPIINRVILEGNKSLKEEKITDELEAEPRSILYKGECSRGCAKDNRALSTSRQICS